MSLETRERERGREKQRISGETSERQHQHLHFEIYIWWHCLRQSSQRVMAHSISLSHTLCFCLYSLPCHQGAYTYCGCICNSGRAITQSLQIFRGVIGYNVAWKWLRAGEAFSQAQKIITVLLGKPGNFRAFSQMSGSHRSGSYSLRTVDCARKHLSYYFDSVSEYLSIDASAVHRHNDMWLQSGLLYYQGSPGGRLEWG